MRTLAFSSLALTLILTSLPALATAPTAKETSDHTADVRKANTLLNGVLADEVRGLKHYLPKRGQADGPNEDFDMYIPGKSIKNSVRPQTREEMARDKATFELAMKYYGHQGDKRFLGTFIESGSPVADGYQWNTQRWAGLMVPSLRKRALDKAKSDGILNIRFGVNLQDLDVRKPESAQTIVDICEEMWARGISPTLAVLFFPSLKQWEVLDENGRVDAMKSYLQNSDFPKDAGRLAEFVLRRVKLAADRFNAENAKRPAHARLPEALVAINPANEAETLAGFNGQFWHGALAPWGDRNAMNSYVPATINIAEATVEIRSAVSRVFGDQRILFVENPAMTTKDYPSHQGDLQMSVNKLILGDDDLMKANFKKLREEPIEALRVRFEDAKSKGRTNVVEASILKYIDCLIYSDATKKEEARLAIILKFEHLRRSHLGYEKQSGKVAKTDALLMLDYYQQSEFRLPRPISEIVHELSIHHGAALKDILEVKDDKTLLNVLRERTQQAEQVTGQKLWNDFQSVNEIDFKALLTAEDGAVLDKLIGLRREWYTEKEPLFVERRNAIGFKMADFDGNDEKRDDALLQRLVEKDSALLKKALGVATDGELRKILRETGHQVQAGVDPVDVADHESIRDILSKDRRRIMRRLFGLRAEIRTGFLPPHYARQIRAGLREGFANTYVSYINELGIRVGGIGEMGTPYYPWGGMVIKQMILELTRASHEANFYIVRVDAGPMVGTIGWMAGPLVGNIKTNNKRASDGVYKLVRKGPGDFDYELSAWAGGKPFFADARDYLMDGLKRQHDKIAEREASKAPLAKVIDHTAKAPVRSSALTCSALFK